MNRIGCSTLARPTLLDPELELVKDEATPCRFRRGEFDYSLRTRKDHASGGNDEYYVVDSSGSAGGGVPRARNHDVGAAPRSGRPDERDVAAVVPGVPGCGGSAR